MKNVILSVIFLLTVLTSFAQQQKQDGPNKKLYTEHGDNNHGTSLKPIIRSVEPVIQYFEDSLKSEIIHLEYDFIFDTKEAYRPFVKDGNFGVCAVGDYRINKIVVRVYEQKNNQWFLLKESENNGKVAIAMFKTPSETMYRFEIIVKEFLEGQKAGRFALILFH